MKACRIITIILLNLLTFNISAFSQKISPIVHDKNKKTVILSDISGNLILRLNYSGGCILDKVIVKGAEVTGNGNAVYSGIRLGDQVFSSKQCITSPVITIMDNSVNIDSIKYGNTAFTVEEKWIFKINGNNIQWQINRQYLNNGTIDENDFPCWQFNSMQTWDGTMLDNGGVAWNRFLGEPGDTYGAHAAALTFWNSSNNSCLRIIPDDDPKTFRVATFSHQKDHVLSVVQSSSTEEINTKYGLRRFLKTGQNVFAPIKISKSGTSIHYTLQALSYDREYDRGELKGINEKSVNEMLNTIGRYGVVDKNLYGSNGWRTGWAVLQEPWLALFGLAIDSPDFINGYSQTLEYERENAIMPDGRVLPRWHHNSTDAMPGTFRANGFYECQWGYMLDAQPAYAIDVAEQFDMTGDIGWLRQFKSPCEKVLDYMIKRDSNGNGLFEVVQKTHKEQKGTDWMDVVWASYEVASINAYMYNALIRWSDLENLLGDKEMSEKYQHLALKLKSTFNKNIADGGFWNPDKKWYVYWREKDGSVYGNNLVSMVNFLAIGYGICDDPGRKDAVLSKIEELMLKEKLFIWPSCFFPYEDGVGLKNVNYPYPNYENGDLFLAWAELGTRCYAEKNPETALKYIHNVISQYEKDGLAYQRYTRLKQTGAGDDILSNNIMAVVGLYRNIYGIRPRYNRLYIEPHLTAELDGTQLKYWLRNQDYVIEISKEKYSISVNNFSVSDKYPFAINSSGNELEYFKGNNNFFSLKISGKQPCSVDILSWGKNNMSWNETGKSQKNNIHHELYNLKENSVYQLLINGKPKKKYTADINGIIRFDHNIDKSALKIQMLAIDSFMSASEKSSQVRPVATVRSYIDGRPAARYRLDAKDQGVVLKYGTGPDSSDYLGVRDIFVFEYKGTFYMHYDGAGRKGWLTCLATSKDMVTWQVKGPVLDYGKPGSEDSRSASYGSVYFDGMKWQMFYIGTPNVSPAPNFIPAFPYLTKKAESNSPAGPWKKRYDITPFSTRPGSYYSAAASPGCIIKTGDEYRMLFSAQTSLRTTKRTLSYARTKNLDSTWVPDNEPFLPMEEQIENSSVYYEPTNKTWFVFTNHVGIKNRLEYTDAIWVYWTKNLDNWNAENKAVVLDSSNCIWSKHIIGLPSVVKTGKRLAIFYDGNDAEEIPAGNKSHMRRDIGLAWLELPLRLPNEK